jgi:hypothetical protein
VLFPLSMTDTLNVLSPVSNTLKSTLAGKILAIHHSGTLPPHHYYQIVAKRPTQ